MIIFDSIGHLSSTESADELHTFAKKIGLKREWYQTPSISKRTGKIAEMGPEYAAHYDLTTFRMKNKAERYGATKLSPFELVKMAWWSRHKFVVKTLEVAVDIDQSFADFQDHPDVGIAIKLLTNISLDGFSGQVDG